MDIILKILIGTSVLGITSKHITEPIVPNNCLSFIEKLVKIYTL